MNAHMTDAETIAALTAKNALLAASLKQAEREADTLRARLADPGQIIRESFNEAPEDVICPINTASEVGYWFEEIFKVIRAEADKNNPDSFKIRRLADMGAYLGSDFGNRFDCRHEDLFDHLKAAGLIDAGAIRLPHLHAENREGGAV
jgi:hypothetical protein